MKLLLSLVCSSLLLFSCGGAGSAVDELASTMTEISKVLEGVTDEASAKAARDQLEPLTGRLSKLQTEAAENAGDASATFDADDARELAEATTSYSEQLTRVLSDPQLVKHLDGVLVP